MWGSSLLNFHLMMFSLCIILSVYIIQLAFNFCLKKIYIYIIISAIIVLILKDFKIDNKSIRDIYIYIYYTINY